MSDAATFNRSAASARWRAGRYAIPAALVVGAALVIGLRMRPGNAPPRHQALMMDADPHQSELAAIGGADRLQFVRAFIVIVVAALDIAPMRNEIVTDHDLPPDNGAVVYPASEHQVMSGLGRIEQADFVPRSC